MEVPIRVVAKVKPPSPEHEACLQVATAAAQIILGFDNFFDFDAVFGDDISQMDLYHTCLADMITNFFHGVNTTVITYGQQNSGKTFTMIGPDFLRAMNEEEFGLLPRAVRDIFKMINKVQESFKMEFRLHVSNILINKESVHDLLSQSLATLTVFEDNMGKSVIPGLTVIDCSSISEVFNCLEFGLLQRHSASMQGFNFISAHSLFMIGLQHQWEDSDGHRNYVYSNLSFADLGGNAELLTPEELSGSERVVTSNDSEVHCNSDMKALANVIYSLANANRGDLGNSPPYRSSRLTQILKDSFGGNSVTLLICNLSPSLKDHEMTHNTLKLGGLARYVMNFPVWNFVRQRNTLQRLTPYLNRNALEEKNNYSVSRGAGILPSNLQVIRGNVSSASGQLEPEEEHLHQPNEEAFRVQFAASQWHQLVSSAEELLGEIIKSGTASPSEKMKIESWLCLKAEADECIGTFTPSLQGQGDSARPLEVIEELSEPNDNYSSVSAASDSEVSSLSLGETFYHNLELLKEKFVTLTADLIRRVEEEYDSCETLLGGTVPNKTVRETNDRIDSVLSESLTEGIESMAVSSSSSSLEEGPSNAGKEEEKLRPTCDGSLASLVSQTSATGCEMRNKIWKKRKKVVDKLRSISGRGKSSLPEAPNGSSEMVTSSNGDFISEENLRCSSENELLSRSSSKFVSSSKGSSKCSVSSLKTKSRQISQSIRSHLLKKINRTSFMQIDSGFPKLSPSEEIRPSVTRVSDKLRVSQRRLKELEATIKVKEAFIYELLRGDTQAGATRKTCLAQISELKEELSATQHSYHKAQNRLMEVDDRERSACEAIVNSYSQKINSIQKRLSSLQKVVMFSQQDDSKVKELDESIRDLQQQREELHTQLREEVQRKQHLEQQILREERCSRNPLCLSKPLDEGSDKEDQELTKQQSGEGDSKKHSTSKKRKLVTSFGDSRSEAGSVSSWKETKVLNGVATEHPEEPSLAIVRKEIDILRATKEAIINRRQKIDKKIRKGRVQGDGREEERRLIELDEAVEGLDAIIELKNGILAGRVTGIEPYIPVLAKHHLEERIRNLPLEELHFLLIKFFSRVIDLRIEFRRHELIYAELEDQYDEQNRYIGNLKAAYQQASLEMERRLTSLQREYQHKISYLLKQFSEDSNGNGIHELVLEMEQQVYYYKKLSRELKEKLLQCLDQGSHHSPSVPGTSGIKQDSVGGLFPHTSQKPMSTPPFPSWPRRGRRFAVHSANSPHMKVTREKNKIIIQQKGDNHMS